MYATEELKNALIRNFDTSGDYEAETLVQMVAGYVETCEELEQLEVLLYTDRRIYKKGGKNERDTDGERIRQ